MLGILCEKPSAAKNFAKALGGMSGTFNGEQYVIAASVGHIFSLVQPDEQVPASEKAKYKAWDMANLPWDVNIFSWERRLSPDKKDVFDRIKKTFASCEEIAIATDVDPSGEGELLAWEILAELKRQVKYSRFYFTDESVKSIQDAFKKRKPIQSMQADGDYRKALYRSQFDFLTMQFTRIVAGYTGQNVRQGRLKSAMAYIVGEQLDKVAAYKKVPFYQWRFRDENGNMFISDNEPTSPEKNLPAKYTQADVVIDSTEQKAQTPPKLIDLSRLSAVLSKKGIKSKTVLATYQKMYESQVVSYPRTEDKTITPEQFNDLLPFVDRIAAVVGVDTKLLTHRQPRNTHVKPVGAHGANRPGPNVPDSLSSLDSTYGPGAAAIYEILARSYLAMLCEDYLYKVQKGHLQQYPDFKGSATCPVSAGYKAIYTDGDDDEDDEAGSGKLLGTKASPFVFEGFPPKPATPTVKWLMKELEKRDIGTGATRTSTFVEVSDSSRKGACPLLEENKGKITLTEAGHISHLILPGTNIGDLELTNRVWAQMKEIGDGKAQGFQFLPDVARMVQEDIVTMGKNLGNVKAKFPNIGPRQPVQQKETFTGMFKGKEVTFKREWGGVHFTDAQCMDLLAGKEISFQAVSSRTGKPYTAKGKLEQQTYNSHKFWGFKPDFGK